MVGRSVAEIRHRRQCRTPRLASPGRRRERAVLPAVTTTAAAHATACSWRIRSCAKSYCAWRRTQNEALLQPSRSSASAIAGEMPVRPFYSRDNGLPGATQLRLRIGHRPAFGGQSVAEALAGMRRPVHLRYRPPPTSRSPGPTVSAIGCYPSAVGLIGSATSAYPTCNRRAGERHNGSGYGPSGGRASGAAFDDDLPYRSLPHVDDKRDHKCGPDYRWKDSAVRAPSPQHRTREHRYHRAVPADHLGEMLVEPERLNHRVGKAKRARSCSDSSTSVPSVE